MLDESLEDINEEDGKEYENDVMNNSLELSGVVNLYNYVFKGFCCLQNWNWFLLFCFLQNWSFVLLFFSI